MLVNVCVCVWGGGGGVRVYIGIYRLPSFFSCIIVKCSFRVQETKASEALVKRSLDNPLLKYHLRGYALFHGERRLIALVRNAALLRLMGEYVSMTSTLTSRPSTPWRTYLEPCRNVLHLLPASVSKMVRTNQIHVDVNCCCSDLKALSASLAVCEGNPPGTGRFHSQRANGDQLQYVYSCRLEKQLLKKQSIRCWLETPCHSLEWSGLGGHLASYRF